MNIKLLSLSLISTLMLSACGGSDNNDQKNQNNTQNPNIDSNQNLTTQHWENFRLDQVYDSTGNIENFEVINTQFNIVNGKLYAIYTDTENNEFYLTQEGEYRGFGPINNSYGAEVGDITVSDTQFKIRPYSPIGSKGLEFTQTHSKLDISGQSVLAALDPDLNWQIKYPQYVESSSALSDQLIAKLKSYQALTFPQGSTCLHETEYANNQSYLVLTDLEDQASFDADAKEYAELNKNYFKYTNFYNSVAYLYSYNGTESNANNGIATYKGLYYDTYKENAGIEFNLDKEIQTNKDLIAQSNYSNEEKSARLEAEDGMHKGCDLYNDVAIKFLKNNIKF